MKIQTVLKAVTFGLALAALPITAMAADSMSAGDSTPTQPYVAPGSETTRDRDAMRQNERAMQRNDRVVNQNDRTMNRNDRVVNQNQRTMDRDARTMDRDGRPMDRDMSSPVNPYGTPDSSGTSYTPEGRDMNRNTGGDSSRGTIVNNR